jgi:hypothetical protein
MKIPRITKLNFPDLLSAASHLESTGKLIALRNNFTYLDIDNDYVHQLFPLLQKHDVKKPDYFGAKAAGAHITVIYPEENKIMTKEDLNKEHSFIIKNIVAAEIDKKIYYVLLVESSSLLQLRKKYHLSELLCFKGYAIGFHITLGVSV